MKRSGPPCRKTPLAQGDKQMKRTEMPRGDVHRAQQKQQERRDRVIAEARSGTIPPKPRAKARPERGSADKAPAQRAMRSTDPSAATIAAVKERDANVCVRCGEPGTNTHHREARGMGGRKGADLERINGLAYLLYLCGSGTEGCHGWVESNRERARVDGYLLRRNSLTVGAHTVPVFTFRGWERFTDDGRRLPCDPPA